MAIAIDQSFLFNVLRFGGYTAQATTSQGTQDISDILTSNLSFPVAKQGELNTTINVSFGYNVYYKMQGYNTVTQKYEDWHSMNEPLLDPPSGNALENVCIIYSWIDR